jgi:hypothetical protein
MTVLGAFLVPLGGRAAKRLASLNARSLIVYRLFVEYTFSIPSYSDWCRHETEVVPARRKDRNAHAIHT